MEEQLKLAQEAEEADRLDEAFSLYKGMLAAESTNVEVLYHFGGLAHRTGNYQAARQMFLQGLGHAPDDARLHLALGKTRGAMGDWPGAIRSIKAANQRQPDNAEVLLHLGVACHETGAFEDCIDYCQQAIELDAALLLARNVVGSALTHLGRHDEAITTFRALIDDNPTDGHVWFNLGNASHLIGQYNDALEAYQQAAELLPDDIEARLTLGAVAYDLDNPGLAAEAFAGAAALDGGRVDAHAGLARALVQLGQNTDAVAAYDRALEITPGDNTLSFERAAASDARIDIAPEDYVIETFDAMAESFDEQLVEVLGYRVPEKLRDAVAQVIGDSKPGWSVADLGCGTGLCGLLFRDWAGHMLGIDLSPAMIRQSEARGVYDELRVESVDDTLRAAASGGTPFELIVAADLFIYIGNLDPIFEGCVCALKPGGYFAFSTEDTDGEDYTVNANMRFSQSSDYIRRLADRHGFTIVSAEQSTLRMEMRKAVMGTIYLLQRPV